MTGSSTAMRPMIGSGGVHGRPPVRIDPVGHSHELVGDVLEQAACVRIY